MTELKTRARLWLRVSNSDQHIANQRLALNALCERRDYIVDREYVAEGVSAWTGEQRVLLNEVLVDARANRFDVLVVWALDRVTREGPGETLQIAEEFRQAGVKIVSLQEPWVEDEGDTRDLFISVVGWSSRQESNRRSERNRLAHARMLAEGKWGQGIPPLGYSRGPEGKLVIEPGEAEIVELIFDLYTMNRMGMRQIKRELEQRGHRTRKGRTFWVPSVIDRILKDLVYTGTHSSGVPAPVIIDDETWQLAQETRASNHHLKTGYTHRYALQGRAACECGGRIRVEHPGRGRGQAIYFCNNRYASSYSVMKGGDRCVVPRRRVDQVELELHRQLKDVTNDPAKLIVMVERSITRIEDQLASTYDDYAGVKSELDEVKEDIGRVEESWLRRRITTDKRDSLVSELEIRRDSLEQRLGETSPDRRQELEEKQLLLTGAKDYLATLQARKELGIPSWTFSFMPAVAESEELQEFRQSGFNEFSRDPNKAPETLEKVLTAFNMTAVFRRNTVDLAGSIELKMMTSNAHPYASLPGEGWEEGDLPFIMIGSTCQSSDRPSV